MASVSDTGEIEIRHCATLEEFDKCVRIEHATWGEGISVPSAIFVAAHHSGGQVLGAFEGATMVGFTLAFAGSRAGEGFLHSHMTAVLADYQDRGIGRSLKLFQRQDALNRGFALVEWTFDPLITKNAYFNFMRLCAIARCHVPNAYGITTSPLHAALPTDRLVAEWHLNSQRVLRILAGKRSTPAFDKMAIRISVPAVIDELRNSNPEKAAQIQAEIRDQFTRSFAKSYAATAVATTPSGVDYILEPFKRSRTDSNWSSHLT